MFLMVAAHCPYLEMPVIKPWLTLCEDFHPDLRGQMQF